MSPCPTLPPLLPTLSRLAVRPADSVSQEQLSQLASRVRLRGLPRCFVTSLLPRLDWYLQGAGGMGEHSMTVCAHERVSVQESGWAQTHSQQLVVSRQINLATRPLVSSKPHVKTSCFLCPLLPASL